MKTPERTIEDPVRFFTVGRNGDPPCRELLYYMGPIENDAFEGRPAVPSSSGALKLGGDPRGIFYNAFPAPTKQKSHPDILRIVDGL